MTLPRGLANPFVYRLLRIARGLRERRIRRRSYNEARAAAARALEKNPNDDAAWQALGDALFRLGRHQAAIAAYDKALARAPDDPVLWNRRAAVVRAGGARTSRFDTEQETKNNPGKAQAWARHAASLAAATRFTEAVIASDRALAINPGHVIAAAVGIRSRILLCEWRRCEDDERQVANAYKDGIDILSTLRNRAISNSEAQNLISAQLYARSIKCPQTPPPGRRYSHDRIRLAYLCAEYHEHPGGRGIVGVLEHHDRSRFEVSAISFGGPNSSVIRQRTQAACEKFIGAHGMSDEQVAEMMRQMEIDIAISIDRFGARGRPGVLARRPAALQVCYFGNAGTTAAPYIDYIVADRTVIPSDHLRYYTEKVIYLPNSYQCNDARRPVPRSTFSRAKAGLPETGFVFCSFNHHYKIRPAVFDVWMQVLHACAGSVLWLYVREQDAIHNLRREAAARGVAPERIVFAQWVPTETHIERLRLADLFLDTLPYNAHVTGSDALWAGVPIVTCIGNTFAGRVGASLLRAVGLPELVTESLPQYEALAISLAGDPGRLAALKERLAQSRDTAPLFDTARLTRDLETAYEAIWHRQQADLPPETISV